ncbi:PilZ domain-containing protein [Desulfocapsa sp. AH-315-G09]|nr:PilZ domain-containing protein [Desulfocapsa sp.]MBN4048529.1 PilZ domain-containing protein [bacterium AH-315-N22]MBN4065197.1 PilZ domain-containing protein [Desulfocapsa sp. AH-315-G09]
MDNQEEKKELSLKNIQKKLAFFFPEESYTFTRQAVEDGVASGDFLVNSSQILPYIQTALLDERILEIQINGMSKVYFSRINDDFPDLEESENDAGELTLTEPDYTAGDYLKRMSHVITLPIEPGMGNLHLRNSQKIVIRFFTSTSAVELGTFFQDLAIVRDIPVLRLAFPVVGRQVREARAFRAKVTQDANFNIFVKGKKTRPDIQTEPIDISADGLSFNIQKKHQSMFQEDEICTVHFLIDEEMRITVKGSVRHISKVREKKGIQYRCGLQLEIPTPSIARDIETIVAMVQRAHLKELSDISEESGITLIK